MQELYYNIIVYIVYTVICYYVIYPLLYTVYLTFICIRETMEPYIIKLRSCSNSNARNFAKAVLGTAAKQVKPVPPKPEFKPELTITPPVEPEVKEEELVLDEPVVETPVVEEPVETVEEPIVETPTEEVKEEAGTSLSELGLSSNNVKNLKFNSITTVEELEAFVNSGEQLAALPKIGNKAEQAILEALITWKEQNQK